MMVLQSYRLEAGPGGSTHPTGTATTMQAGALAYTSFRYNGAGMKIELTPDAAQWVEAEVACGRFLTAEDAVRYAVNQVKIMELRAALDAAEAEGGEFSSEEVRQYAYDHLDRIKLTPAR
jgi:Arc/MetJ-type ribon-helix-helix transcriptional regulator